MKFSATFASSGLVEGPGAIFVDETGIIVEADIPRFRILLISGLLRKIICSRGVRTIPYSRIIEYKVPKFWNGWHRLAYRLPDQSRCLIRFRLSKAESISNMAFSARINEYQTAMKQFQPERG